MEGFVRDRFRLIYLKSTGPENTTLSETSFPHDPQPREKESSPPFVSQALSSHAYIEQAKVDLQHPEAKIRILAIQFLERVESSVARPLVQDALIDPDPEVRAQAALSLIKLGSPDAASLVKKHLEDSSPKVKLAALRGIFRLGEGLDLDTLHQLLSDESPWVRRKMATLLGWDRREGSLPILEELSRDPIAEVRKAALYSLVTLFPEESEDRLMKATADADPDLRKWARKTLERIAERPALPQGRITVFPQKP